MNDETPSTPGIATGVMEPNRALLILTLGILSLALCCFGFFTGIPAWIMGKGDLAKIKDGMMDPEGKGPTKAGMICGIIVCIMSLSLWVTWFVLDLWFPHILRNFAIAEPG